MIKKLKVQNFKSFKELDLEFGQLNFVIGTNASGKSNLFDALRFLQGVGNKFSLSQIIDGKPKSATSEVWAPIRGGSTHLAFKGCGDMPIQFQVTMENSVSFDWGIEFDPTGARLINEKLDGIYGSHAVTNQAGHPVFRVAYHGKKAPGQPPRLEFESGRPVLPQFLDTQRGKKEERDRITKALHSLANMQRIDPLPSILREYSTPHFIERMGEHGENFAALVKTIAKDPDTKEAYLEWLQQLRPQEVEDIKVLTGAVGELMFCLEEGGKEFAAPVLSDGTLRFAAITAALFQPDMPGIMTIEEIENGIHASRLRLMMELLRSQSDCTDTQLFVTTHSPIVLAWLKEEEYQHTFYCMRDDATGESKVTPLTGIPHFNETIQKQPISDLFAEGWLEAAL
jgi:energy-coupling factor transporter ATP-binding protein EcfA2